MEKVKMTPSEAIVETLLAVKAWTMSAALSAQPFFMDMLDFS